MKHFLLFIAIFAYAGTTFGQDTSFEADEGYQLGEINGQLGWEAISFFSYMFTVSDEQASDGDYALRLGIDEQGFIPGGSTTGPSRDMSAEIPSDLDTYEISADMYISSTESGEGEIDFNIYGAAGTEGLPGATIALLQDKVLIIELSDFSVGAEVPVAADTFYHLTFQFDFINEQTLFYVDDSLVYMGDLNVSQITGYGFFTTGKAVGYADNVTTVNNPVLGISEADQIAFSHYSSGNQLYLESSAEMKSVTIYSVSGQQVLSASLGAARQSIAIGHLSRGIYLARVDFDGHERTFKFVR